MVSGLLYLETRAEPRRFFHGSKEALQTYRSWEVYSEIIQAGVGFSERNSKGEKNQKKLPTNVGKLGEAPTNHLQQTIRYVTNAGIPVNGFGSNDALKPWLDDLDLLLQYAETVKQKHTCQNDTLQPMLRWSRTHFPQRNTCCLYYPIYKHWDILHLLGWISWTYQQYTLRTMS